MTKLSKKDFKEICGEPFPLNVVFICDLDKGHRGKHMYRGYKGKDECTICWGNLK